nr:hypothetical protein [Tistrella mobilis]
MRPVLEGPARGRHPCRSSGAVRPLCGCRGPWLNGDRWPRRPGTRRRGPAAGACWSWASCWCSWPTRSPSSWRSPPSTCRVTASSSPSSST